MRVHLPSGRSAPFAPASRA